MHSHILYFQCKYLREQRAVNRKYYDPYNLINEAFAKRNEIEASCDDLPAFGVCEVN